MDFFAGLGKKRKMHATHLFDCQEIGFLMN